MIDEENQLDDAQPKPVNPTDGAGSSPEPEVAEPTPEAGNSGLDQAFAEAMAASEESQPPPETTVSASADLLAKLATAEAELQSFKAQLEDRSGQYMRIAADFDNYRKRTQREKEEFEQQIKCSTLNELLPVVDNFERARAQIKPQTEQETTIHKSYQSVYKQLVDCLKRIGVAPMRAEGKEFDPTMHEAVNTQPTDEYPEGTVIEEYQRGYMLGDRVLRHALVKVAAPPNPVIPSEETIQGTSDG
jgi:molecular chaperone GrpE